MNVLPFFMGARSAPDIADLFATSLYTGNGSTQTITNGIDLAGEGGLVWRKDRDSGSNSHWLEDTIRGVGNLLRTNATDAAATTSGYISAFNGDGYSFGSAAQTNTLSNDYVSWTFRRAPKFFDVVTFTHTNGVTSNVATDLTVPLGLATVKRLDSTSDWYTNHRSLTAGYNLRLNTSAAESNTAAYVSFSGSTLVFDSAAPSGDCVAYVWGHEIGMAGSYVGNSSGSTTQLINLGRPTQAVLLKKISGSSDWFLLDTTRGFAAGNDPYLRLNLSGGETTSLDMGATDPDGFVVGPSTNSNNNGSTYIYYAIPAPS